MKSSLKIATQKPHFEAAKGLFLAYAEYLKLDLEFQGFTQELASLDAMYGAPKGALLLAKLGDAYVGAVGLREHSEGVAEMKRLYILPEHQGLGIGKALIEAFVLEASKLGYRSIKLDTVASLDRAVQLYRRAGFVEIPSYRFNPYPDAIFMEKLLEPSDDRPLFQE